MNTKWIFSIVVAVALTIALGITLHLPQKDDVLENQRTVLGINISNGTIITETDSHGWFGDGTTFLEVVFEDDSCLNQIKGHSSWKQLPVTYPVDALLYGIQNGSSSIGPYVTEGGKKLFPKADAGYYYFEDRYSGAGNQGNKDIVNRHSFNFTVALYDEDTRTLYYCEFDT